jgi:hypothetical protein
MREIFTLQKCTFVEIGVSPKMGIFHKDGLRPVSRLLPRPAGTPSSKKGSYAVGCCHHRKPVTKRSSNNSPSLGKGWPQAGVGVKKTGREAILEKQWPQAGYLSARNTIKKLNVGMVLKKMYFCALTILSGFTL